MLVNHDGEVLAFARRVLVGDARGPKFPCAATDFNDPEHPRDHHAGSGNIKAVMVEAVEAVNPDREPGAVVARSSPRQRRRLPSCRRCRPEPADAVLHETKADQLVVLNPDGSVEETFPRKDSISIGLPGRRRRPPTTSSWPTATPRFLKKGED